jgi:hypothetical protein
MIKNIEFNNEVLAIIISPNYEKKGIEFYTPDDYSQQVGYMNRDKNYVIEPHVHLRQSRNINYTNEVLIVKKGKVKVDFYTDLKEFIKSEIIKTGDLILLIKGGHGFEFLEESQLIEIKQGPYIGEIDKERF